MVFLSKWKYKIYIGYILNEMVNFEIFQIPNILSIYRCNIPDETGALAKKIVSIGRAKSFWLKIEFNTVKENVLLKSVLSRF